MKNIISFKGTTFEQSYNKALNWLHYFNTNQIPSAKIKAWKADYVDNHLILRF